MVEIMGGYAVIDLETTGLFPGMHDRVVEIGVVQVSAAGDLEDSYATLVNPARDLGPTEIHGLTAADGRRAPTFAAIAGDVLERLAGRVPVAHNLPFDILFLTAELTRLDVTLPVTAANGLCTMRLADEYLPAVGRTLAACCAAAGIDNVRPHAALDDAMASADLLRCYVNTARRPLPWQPLLDQAGRVRWPVLPPQRTPCVHRGAAAAARESAHFLGRIAATSARTSSPDIDAYLAVVDDVLIDRCVSDTEADALVQLAAALGLDAAEARVAHETYLNALAAAAWADGVITAAERADLASVAELLGLVDTDVAKALARNVPGQAVPPQRLPAEGRALGEFRLAPGDLVVFTGEMSRSRDEWARVATNAGLAVNGQNVTKQTRLVVAADPDSMSGKARKAHEYGIPVVTEDAFARMIRDLTPS